MNDDHSIQLKKLRRMSYILAIQKILTKNALGRPPFAFSW